MRPRSDVDTRKTTPGYSNRICKRGDRICEQR